MTVGPDGKWYFNHGNAGAFFTDRSGRTFRHGSLYDPVRSGGGTPGAFVDYKAQLYAWLVKHKEYPRRARLRRQEGTAQLYFALDRNGQVLEYRIVASSGYKLLDEEVVSMIERASPLPPPPDSLTGERLDYRRVAEALGLLGSLQATGGSAREARVTLEAALHGDNIPTTVVENLIAQLSRLPGIGRRNWCSSGSEECCRCFSGRPRSAVSKRRYQSS